MLSFVKTSEKAFELIEEHHTSKGPNENNFMEII